MRRKLLSIALIIGLIFSSCRKDFPEPSDFTNSKKISLEKEWTYDLKDDNFIPFWVKV